jgi:hypothetical protein
LSRKLLLLLPAFLVGISCDYVEKAEDILETCTDACVQVDTCSVEPPDPNFGSMGASGIEGLDCAGGCASDDRELRGYSDCQLTCIVESTCDTLADCWKPESELYAQYCLDGRTVPEIVPDVVPDNGTQSGSERADRVLSHPSVAIAVDDAGDAGGFVVHTGDHPPQLVGKFDVVGQIDESSYARPVGSPIRTSICFWDYTEGPGGVEVTYCEDGVPGQDSAPLTGDGRDFTTYFEFPDATILFSGRLEEDGTASSVEALVVYTYAVDVWELSHTDWTPAGDCNSCDE